MIDIKRFRSEKNISQKEMCAILGIAQPYLSAIESGKRPLSDAKTKLLYNHFGDIILEYKQADIVIHTNEPVHADIPNGMTLAKIVPLVPVSAQGGPLNEFVKSVDINKCEQIISPVMDVDMALTVAGDSMAPEYPSGCKVLVRKINHEAFIEWGKAYVVDTCNGVVIKCIVPSENKDCIKCISINPDPRFAPFDIHKNDIYAIHKVMMCLALK